MLESDSWNSLSYICLIPVFCKSVKKKKRILPLATAGIKLEDVWGVWKSVLSRCSSKILTFDGKKLKHENCSIKNMYDRGKNLSYVSLHNSQGKINHNSKKSLQESTLWTRSSHQLVCPTCIRKMFLVSHAYLFLCKRFTNILTISAEGRAALLVLKAALQRSTRLCPCQGQRTALSSHHATQSLSFISSSFRTAVLIWAFARQRGNFKRLKEMWSKDLQISMTLFLQLCFTQINIYLLSF